MVVVMFFEKPGCRNNIRQKRMLAEAGHVVIARNLLTETWTAERLRGFFVGLPVAAWFNRAAPRVKSGEIRPDEADADSALALMLSDPLLIRRPLIEAADGRMAGFEADRIAALLGPLGDAGSEACPRQAGQHCP